MKTSNSIPDLQFGIRANLVLFAQLVLQVFLVGLTIGMFRTVVPALAESEFGVTKGSFMMLMAFVTAFGFVKGTLNFVAGRLSERIGRQKVLFLGWLAALPIPLLILYAPSWNWIVAATVLLGINQGLTWSMTQTSKLDLTTAAQRGLTIGINEFARYFGVAVAGLALAHLFSKRQHVDATHGAAKLRKRRFVGERVAVESSKREVCNKNCHHRASRFFDMDNARR